MLGENGNVETYYSESEEFKLTRNSDNIKQSISNSIIDLIYLY